MGQSIQVIKFLNPNNFHLCCIPTEMIHVLYTQKAALATDISEQLHYHWLFATCIWQRDLSNLIKLPQLSGLDD